MSQSCASSGDSELGRVSSGWITSPSGDGAGQRVQSLMLMMMMMMMMMMMKKV